MSVRTAKTNVLNTKSCATPVGTTHVLATTCTKPGKKSAVSGNEENKDIALGRQLELESVEALIARAINNPMLDRLTAKQALGLLFASLRLDYDEDK